MKKTGKFLSILVLVTGLSVSAKAALVDMHDGTIYDTETQLSWLKDAGSGGRITWDQAVAWASGLNGGRGFAGLIGWRLPQSDPTCGGDGFQYNCINSEMGHLYYTVFGAKLYEAGQKVDALKNAGPFTNLKGFYYWTGQASLYWDGKPNFACTFAWDNGDQSPRLKEQPACAWAVRYGTRSHAQLKAGAY